VITVIVNLRQGRPDTAPCLNEYRGAKRRGNLRNSEIPVRIRGAPAQLGLMFRSAWVGGSIWGLQLGGLGALIVGCVAFGTRWRRLSRTHPWRPDLETEARCGRCGYIVKGLEKPRCPECGADLRDVGVRTHV